MKIFSNALLNTNNKQPIITFGRANLTRLEDFNSPGITINWNGTPRIENNGIRTPPNSYGIFDYDLSDFEEITFSYTFCKKNNITYRALINLGYKDDSNVWGVKIEGGEENEKTLLFGLGVNNNDLIKVDNNVRIMFPTVLNKIYNIIIVVSRKKPIKIYQNGIKKYTISQPRGEEGFNPSRINNITKHGFNYRFSNNSSECDTIHYAFTLWDKPLSEEQILTHYDMQRKLYGIEV